MILNVVQAQYVEKYQVEILFNNAETLLVDLEETIMHDSRRIFFPLRDVEYFKSFQIKFNTITWENEADFAPEFLLELGKSQLEHLTAKH